jgi:cation transport ATPase
VTTIETDHQHGHGAHGDHGDRRGHGVHDGHAGHDPDLFRRRFWLSLALTIPLVVTSEMVQDWFGYSLDVPGIEVIAPVLGSIVFWWGGWPFLTGGVAELRARRPGMMLLISLAIIVAYAASLATSLRLSEASYRKMLENLGWAAGYNLVAIPLAAGILAGAGITLSPAVAAVLMSLSTIIVALNAQTLRRVELLPAS